MLAPSSAESLTGFPSAQWFTFVGIPAKSEGDQLYKHESRRKNPESRKLLLELHESLAFMLERGRILWTPAVDVGVAADTGFRRRSGTLGCRRGRRIE